MPTGAFSAGKIHNSKCFQIILSYFELLWELVDVDINDISWAITHVHGNYSSLDQIPHFCICISTLRRVNNLVQQIINPRPIIVISLLYDHDTVPTQNMLYSYLRTTYCKYVHIHLTRCSMAKKFKQRQHLHKDSTRNNQTSHRRATFFIQN